jgi:hypothetical protein
MMVQTHEWVSKRSTESTRQTDGLLIYNLWNFGIILKIRHNPYAREGGSGL